MDCRTINNVEIIYHLCNKHQWFTDGTNSQYNRMFDLARVGIKVNILAWIIWVCSDTDTHSYNEIFNTIKSTNYVEV